MLNIKRFKYLTIIFAVVFSFLFFGLYNHAAAEKKIATKIAVASTGPTLDDTVASRFGHSPYFLIIKTDNMEFEALPNTHILGGGAGYRSAQLIVSRNVSVVLTSNCGPNPCRVFNPAGVQVITGISGQVREAVKKYISGTLGQTYNPNGRSPLGKSPGRRSR
ncbi:NifB/NifX family molybdenum-iron cluster-binding protein [Thermodesulfobacteriota bacterium]